MTLTNDTRSTSGPALVAGTGRNGVWSGYGWGDRPDAPRYMFRRDVDFASRIPAGESNTLEKVARHMLRSPVGLPRLQWSPCFRHVLYAPKTSHEDPSELFSRLQKIDALDF